MYSINKNKAKYLKKIKILLKFQCTNKDFLNFRFDNTQILRITTQIWCNARRSEK